MVVKQVPRERASMIMLQKLTIRKRQPFLRIIYGSIMVSIGLTMILIDPLQLITNWALDVKEGSVVFNMWQNPTYELFAEVWVFNYTNTEEYLDGRDQVLKLQEIGPFLYQEFRTNRNMTVDKERGVMKMMPHIDLKFLKDQSIADVKDVSVVTPNSALLLISTLLADKLGYLANVGAYYSITNLGSKVFRNLTVYDMLWGFEDPTVTIANALLPGWIDFNKIGILDRFYAKRRETVEVDIRDTKDKFSIVNWDDSAGIVEQGFTDLNTSIPCNRARGSYEGLMLSPGLTKDKVIPIFRRQACRIYPFTFHSEVDNNDYGFKYYRFTMEKSAFNTTSPYACPCSTICLPDGFVDVANCYYGFPIALSKPHFLYADPRQMRHYEGLKPDPEKHESNLDLEPTMGIPVSLASKIQVNLAVRVSSGNPITKPFKDKMVPLLWISLHCKRPPSMVANIMWLRLIVAPVFMIIIEVILIIVGFIIIVNGFYRCIRPKYSIIASNDEKSVFLS